MAEQRKILIADSDRETVKALKVGLRDSFHVVAARDGSRALELAITEYPDLIMFYRHCPLIGAKQFLRILRTNPRTETIPLIILSDDPMTGATLPGYLEGVLVKPLNLDEVRGRLRSVFQRVDAAREVGQERGEVQGSIAQISMVDLLQVFAMNRRSGCIRLHGGPDRESAEVFVAEGRIEDARVGLARGEKALYRLLAWTDGTFSFVPGLSAATSTITASTDTLLIEGMRQGDELARIRDEMPASDAEVRRLVAPEELPPGLHPVTAEIFDLLNYYSRVGDLIDRAQATDLEVALALQSLAANDVVRLVETTVDDGVQPLLTQEAVFDVLGRLRQAAVAPTFLHRPRLVVLCVSPDRLREFSGSLMRLAEFSAGNLEHVVAVGFGSLGTLDLGSGFTPELYALAPDERLLPLAFSLSAGCVGAILLGPADGSVTPVLAMLSRERRIGVVAARRSATEHTDVELLDVVDIRELDEAAARTLIQRALSAVNAAELRDVSV